MGCGGFRQRGADAPSPTSRRGCSGRPLSSPKRGAQRRHVTRFALPLGEERSDLGERYVIRAEIITDSAALARLREPWRDLLARSWNDEPMASPTWLLAWWSVFGARGGRTLKTVALF